VPSQPFLLKMTFKSDMKTSSQALGKTVVTAETFLLTPVETSYRINLLLI
jgi:hypothetical protein